MFECSRVESWSRCLFRADSTNHIDRHMYEEHGTATCNGDSVCRSADLLSCNAQYLPHILRYREEKIGKARPTKEENKIEEEVRKKEKEKKKKRKQIKTLSFKAAFL